MACARVTASRSSGANSIDWIITFWATISLGAIVCALNGWWTGPEIEYAIGYTEPKLLVADRKRIARMDGAAAASPSGREPQASRGGADVPIVVMEDDFPTLTTAHPDAALADVELGDDDPAILLFTSGTTGRPKGAVHTHGNVCSLLAMLFFQGARAAMTASPPAPGAPPPTPACQFMTSPLFHVSGLHTGAVMFMATGTRSVWWMGRFDPRKVAPVIERERCTGLVDHRDGAASFRARSGCGRGQLRLHVGEDTGGWWLGRAARDARARGARCSRTRRARWDSGTASPNARRSPRRTSVKS